MSNETMKLTREEIWERRRWWQHRINEGRFASHEEILFWRSEVTLCDMALRAEELERASDEYIARTDPLLFCNEDFTCGQCRGCYINRAEAAESALSAARMQGKAEGMEEAAGICWARAERKGSGFEASRHHDFLIEENEAKCCAQEIREAIRAALPEPHASKETM